MTAAPQPPYGAAPSPPYLYSSAPPAGSTGRFGSAPPPPPGPGVRAPFVAPPTDGTRQRRWLAIVLSIATAVLCCVGGLAGLGGLVVLGGRMISEQAQTAVRDYLTAVQAKDYQKAYSLLCDREQQRTPEPLFAYNTDMEPLIRSFQTGEPVVQQDIRVPTTLVYYDGTSQTVQFLVEQDKKTAEFEVCGRTG